MKIQRTKFTKKKISSSEIRTTGLVFRSTVPITARPHRSLQTAPQNKVYEEMQISCYLYEETQMSCYYYMISTSNYEKLAVSCIFLLGLHVFNVSVITESDIYVVGRDIRKAIHMHGVRSID